MSFMTHKNKELVNGIKIKTGGTTKLATSGDVL